MPMLVCRGLDLWPGSASYSNFFLCVFFPDSIPSPPRLEKLKKPLQRPNYMQLLSGRAASSPAKLTVTTELLRCKPGILGGGAKRGQILMVWGRGVWGRLELSK